MKEIKADFLFTNLFSHFCEETYFVLKFKEKTENQWINIDPFLYSNHVGKYLERAGYTKIYTNDSLAVLNWQSRQSIRKYKRKLNKEYFFRWYQEIKRRTPPHQELLLIPGLMETKCHNNPHCY